MSGSTEPVDDVQRHVDLHRNSVFLTSLNPLNTEGDNVQDLY